jgi:glycine hydroxymethyltransferase
MGQALIDGGHLTHGHNVSATGIFFKSVQYGVKTFVGSKEDLFDFKEIRKLAKEHKPKLIWAGGTAHPLIFDYKKFAEIADEVGAYLAVDIAHIAGLIAGGVHPSPVKYAHIITTTTHKTLRGPRGAMIMVTNKGLKKDSDLAKKIDRAVFPGLQGGPHDNTTAGIAVALFEAAQPSFKKYAAQIVKNSKILAKTLINGGLKLVGGRSENHLSLVDLTTLLGPGGGIFAQKALDMVGLTLNKNTVPDETSSPFYPSGVRLGTPAATTRGMKEKEMGFIGMTILKVIEIIKLYRLPENKEERKEYIANFQKEVEKNKEIIKMRDKVKKLALHFPIP